MLNKDRGYTLIHEHITIDLSSVKGDSDCRLDCLNETVQELRTLYDCGVRNIVDVTNIGMGRNIAYVNEVEKMTGIHILSSTGFYKEPFLPEIVYSSTAEELAELMTKEIEEGIEDSGVKARMIGEIGTSKDCMKPMEEKIFKASVMASKETKCPIYTHTTLGTYALSQAQYLIQNGAVPEQVVIGHVDLTGDLDTVLRVLNTGVSVGFDTIGKNNYMPDAVRIDMLMELEKRGLMKQVMLSMDLTRKSHLAGFGGIGYDYLFKDFLPKLREAGIREESIDYMLIHNPERLFH